jgi:hypothetical protein
MSSSSPEVVEAGSAFFAFLTRMTGEAGAKQDLADAIAGAGAGLGNTTVQTATDLREIFAAPLGRVAYCIHSKVGKPRFPTSLRTIRTLGSLPRHSSRSPVCLKPYRA